MKFLVYSDIHHHIWSTGITLEDTLNVEDQITQSLLSNRCDFLLFCGDRFESRNPHDQVKLCADEKLIERVDQFNGPIFALVGNHDQWFKKIDSGHSYLSWKLFQGKGEFTQGPLANVMVMDKPMTYRVPGLVAVHALPAGSKFDLSHYSIASDVPNILVIHDLLQGSTIDLNGHKWYSGMSLSEIDHSCFDMIFAGDIHIPQKIPFKNTKGGYVGSTLQHTRRDRGDNRGWIVAETNLVDKKYDIATQFFPSNSPQFIDLEISASELGNPGLIPILNHQAEDSWGVGLEGNIVTITAKGSREILDKYSSASFDKEVTETSKARKVTLVKEPDSTFAVEIEGIDSADNSPEGDLDLYLKSGYADLSGLDPEIIRELAHEVFDD